MVEITCGSCKKPSSADKWIDDLSGCKLPDGYIQCPECKQTIRVVVEPGKLVEIEGNHLYIP